MKREVFLPPFEVKKRVSALSEVYDYGLDLLNVRPAWTVTEGEDTVCAVIDSGYQPHIDLEGAMLEDKCASFLKGKESTPIDLGCYHGLHVLGIIGARKGNSGIVGVAPKCKLISLKALDKNGTGSFDAINAALERCLELKPDVVSMSLGSPSPNRETERLIRKLKEIGIPCVVAAGNDGGEVGYPARYEDVICVAAVNKDGVPTDFSSRGNSVDFVSAGKDVYSCWKDNTYASLSGSSMSAPAISALVLLLISAHKKRSIDPNYKSDLNSVDDIVAHLIKYSAKNGTVVRDPLFGYGVVDIGKMTDDDDFKDMILTKKDS